MIVQSLDHMWIIVTPYLLVFGECETNTCAYTITLVGLSSHRPRHVLVLCLSGDALSKRQHFQYPHSQLAELPGSNKRKYMPFLE